LSPWGLAELEMVEMQNESHDALAQMIQQWLLALCAIEDVSS